VAVELFCVLRTQPPPEEKLPFELGLTEKLTVPLGVDFVPLSVSVTVAVQVVPVLASTVDGAQLTVVVVVRVLTLTEVVLLPERWVESPP
jgi:hypothetical protein